MATEITDSTRVVATEAHLSTEIDGETVILELDDGIYYGLNEVCTRIWQLLAEPVTIEEIQSALVEEYDVPPARCRADVRYLLDDLADQGLLEVLD